VNEAQKWEEEEVSVLMKKKWRRSRKCNVKSERWRK
jgi:hypothetical protein